MILFVLRDMHELCDNRRYTCEATVDGKTVSATVRTLDTDPLTHETAPSR